MTNQIQANAASAVQQLQARAGGKLDYSPASLAVVEEMLAEAAAQSLSQPSREALIELLGCYILEVGLREPGGNWLDRLCGGALLALAGSLALYRRHA